MTEATGGAAGNWDDEGSSDGMASYKLLGWASFGLFLSSVIEPRQREHRREYIWRGQECADWLLEPSLDRRLLKTLDPGERERITQEHLKEFKYATRGRRGTTHPPGMDDENDWWSLGQHYGLATPLLDWTRSPYAAAFFAYEKARTDFPHCAVYALDRKAVEVRNISAEEQATGERNTLEFINPLSHENPRLVNQGALFTRAPGGIDVATWVKAAFKDSTIPILYKLSLPTAARDECLRVLDQMNINHLSLYPDLPGASQFANLMLEQGKHNK